MSVYRREYSIYCLNRYYLYLIIFFSFYYKGNIQFFFCSYSIIINATDGLCRRKIITVIVKKSNFSAF